MREVTSPIIAIVLTLTAVFRADRLLALDWRTVPRQFAVTISISVVISAGRADAVAGTLRTDSLLHVEPNGSSPRSTVVLPT
jgi:multidrug efflux pump subunit AcrB